MPDSDHPGRESTLPTRPVRGGSDASAAVLAGGASRRMGRDKRAVDAGGQPLLHRAIEAARDVCDDVMVVTSPARPVPGELVGTGSVMAGVRVVEDRREDAGPLAGIEAALLAARHDLVLVLAGDHPQASPVVLASLLRTLAALPSADAVALGTRRGPQPLVAAYRRSVAATVTALLDGGEQRATSLPDHLTMASVAESSWRDDDPSGQTAVDVDTPEELLRWEATR